MIHIDYDIERELVSVDQAVADRRSAEGQTAQRLQELDEMVCLSSRALYSRYVDAIAWRGSVDDPTYEAVGRALSDSVASVTDSLDPNSIKQCVVRRLSDFEMFSAKLRRQHQSAVTEGIPVSSVLNHQG